MHDAVIHGTQESGLACFGSFMVNKVHHGELCEDRCPVCREGRMSAGIRDSAKDSGWLQSEVHQLRCHSGEAFERTPSQCPDLPSSCAALVQPACRMQVPCSRVQMSSCCLQDRYCAMSTTYGNSTTGTFKHPAEIFNFQKLLSVPNPFNIDLSLYTATAAASASPIKPPSKAHPGSLQHAHQFAKTLQLMPVLGTVLLLAQAALGHAMGRKD